MKNSEPVAFDSIIFDLDGTLWDASSTCTKAWNAAFAESAIADYSMNEETIRSFSGLRIEKIFGQHFHFIPAQEHAGLLECYKRHEASLIKKLGGQLYPEVAKVLRELKKEYKLFIVSNCLVGYIEGFIEFNELENIFSDFESSGNTGLPKKENIRLIVERNSLNNPVHVGDTIWDYEAASGNSIPFIYASYGFGKSNGYICKIEEFRELPEQLLHLAL